METVDLSMQFRKYKAQLKALWLPKGPNLIYFLLFSKMFCKVILRTLNVLKFTPSVVVFKMIHLNISPFSAQH